VHTGNRRKIKHSRNNLGSSASPSGKKVIAGSDSVPHNSIEAFTSTAREKLFSVASARAMTVFQAVVSAPQNMM